MTADDALRELRWAAVLPLTPDQRLSLKELCFQIQPGSQSRSAREPQGLVLRARRYFRGDSVLQAQAGAKAKRQALARAEAAEKRVRELEPR